MKKEQVTLPPWQDCPVPTLSPLMTSLSDELDLVSGSGLAFSQIRCLLKNERTRGRPVYQLPTILQTKLEKGRTSLHSPSMVAGYARNADDGSGISFGSRRWFLFPLKYEAQETEVPRTKSPVKQKLKTLSRNGTQPEKAKKSTSGKKATKFLLEGVISLGLAAQSVLGNSSQTATKAEVSEVSSSDRIQGVSVRNASKEDESQAGMLTLDVKSSTDSADGQLAKDAPWQYTWTPEKGDYWAYELGYRLSSSAVSTIASALDYARGKMTATEGSEHANATDAIGNQSVGLPFVTQTELWERGAEDKSSALATFAEGTEPQSSSVFSLSNDADAPSLNLSLGANLSGGTGHESQHRSKREEFFHFMQNLAFWQMEFWKADEPGNISLSDRNRTELLSDQEERVLEAWKEAEAFIKKEEKVLNSSTELAGSVLFQGLLADSISSDPLQETNASAIDGLTGVAKDEVQDLFVGLFEGMNPVSSPPSLPLKMDGADVQDTSAEPEVPKAGGTQSFALVSSSSGSLADAVVRLFKSVGLDSGDACHGI
eukprot:768782-Hanusia_phi.AAC.3